MFCSEATFIPQNKVVRPRQHVKKLSVFFFQSRYFFVGVVVSSTSCDAFQNPACSKKQFSWPLASTRWDFAAQTSMDSRWQHTTVTKKSSYFCKQIFLFYNRMVLKMESWFFFLLKTGSWSGVKFWCTGLISRVGTRRISLKYLHKNGMLDFEGYTPTAQATASFDLTEMLGKFLHFAYLQKRAQCFYFTVTQLSDTVQMFSVPGRGCWGLIVSV